MGKRWRPPPTAAPKERMDKTASEFVAECKAKDQEKSKGSKTLADWENIHDDPDSTGAIKVANESGPAAGPAAPKKEKKKDKKKEKKEKKKKDKDKKKKKKDKKKKKSSSSSSSSDSSSGDAEAKKKKKRAVEALSSKTGFRISQFLKGGSDSEIS
ncbi:unnamed protein product [Polarella glacialis]|uniref:Uncharacterized protein n=1 Tax=Polarella glacialis TaxID=89957 RepID=A0A813JCH1_POLGL|nr:unnamed protein product [Polarella glacialis]CAE8672971.1 unnamed protein product [Polarella glacialis]